MTVGILVAFSILAFAAFLSGFSLGVKTAQHVHDQEQKTKELKRRQELMLEDIA